MITFIHNCTTNTDLQQIPHSCKEEHLMVFFYYDRYLGLLLWQAIINSVKCSMFFIKLKLGLIKLTNLRTVASLEGTAHASIVFHTLINDSIQSHPAMTASFRRISSLVALHHPESCHLVPATIADTWAQVLVQGRLTTFEVN